MDIQLRHITKKFEQKMIINDLNITFLENRMNCLMGASGSGKTTIINLILGLIKSDSGELLGCMDKRFAAVFQEDRLIEHWNAVKNIKLVCDKSVSEATIQKELQKLDLKEQDKPVSNYSGGMRRRVAIVRALLSKYDIVIMDEPFKGMDEALKIKVIQYVKQNTVGKTVIVVTHDKAELVLLEANLVLL